MADQKSRGGKKQERAKQSPAFQKRQGVAATTNKGEKGHSLSAGKRQEYLKETKGQR